MIDAGPKRVLGVHVHGWRKGEKASEQETGRRRFASLMAFGASRPPKCIRHRQPVSAEREGEVEGEGEEGKERGREEGREGEGNRSAPTISAQHCGVKACST